jgi:hypothetical protein
VGQAPRLEERARQLGRTLGRKEKKILAALDGKLGALDVAGWIAAVRATHRRAGLILAGDLPTVLGRVDAGDAVARDMVAWSVAEASLTLRRELLS